MGKMISITWDRPNLCVIGAGDGHAEIPLMPGANMIPAATWEAIKKNLSIKNLIKDEVIVEGEEVDGETSAEGLATMKPAAAIKQVKETFDVKALGAWLKTETRPHVKAAIEAQIASIEAKGKGEGTGAAG